MTPQEPSYREQTSFRPTIFSKYFYGVLGTGGQIPARWRKKGRETETVELDEKNEKIFHQWKNSLTCLEFNFFKSSCNSQKEASTAEGWAAMTTLPWRFSRSRQILRNRRFKRLRITAVPKFLRTTKTTPGASPPQRNHRCKPLTHPINQAAKRLRPRRRRRLIIERPLGVRIRPRKPCLFRRFLLLG